MNENLTIYSKNHLDRQYYFHDKCNNVLRVENLNEDLIKLLIELDIPIKHYNYLKKNKKLNNTNKCENILFDNELIDNINIFYKKDFEVYNYKMVKNVEELEDYKNNLVNENLQEICEKYKDYFLKEEELIEYLNNFIKDVKDVYNDNDNDEESLDYESEEC